MNTTLKEKKQAVFKKIKEIAGMKITFSDNPDPEMKNSAEKKGFWHENLVYIIVGLLGAAFSFIFIMPPFDADIINYDSSYQYFLTLHSWEEMLKLIPEDFSPPLYAILLKLWTMIFGETLAAMRAFAVIPLCAMQFLAVFPIRKAFGGKASVLCSVFFAMNAVSFFIVTEIRPATIAFFFVTAAAIYSYIALFYDHKYAYVCFTVFAILSMYTHNIGMLAMLGFYISAFFVALAQKKRRHAVKFLISGAISAVSYIPWLFVVLHQFKNVKTNYWSSGKFTLLDLYYWTIGANFDDRIDQILSKTIIPVALLIMLISYLSVRKNREKLRGVKSASGFKALVSGKFKEPVAKTIFMILLYITPMIVLILFCVVGHPIIADRYFFLFRGVALMMIAAGFTRFSGRIGTAVLSVLVAISFWCNASILKCELELCNFSDMIDHINNSAPADEIAFVHASEWTVGMMSYYFPEATHYITDDTYCDAPSWEVFNAAYTVNIVNIGKLENLDQYDDGAFVFNDLYVCNDVSLLSVYEENENYNVERIKVYGEPYSFRKIWPLAYVSCKNQNVS